MKSLVRKLIPNWFINYFYHFPQALLANIKYGFPGRKIKVIGVTGTDGKTTTTNMVYQILRNAGKKVSMVSTINAEIAGKTYDTGLHVTNPEPYDVQKFLSQAVKAGDEYMVFEVTSHGLDQFRVWGVGFEVGVITNITHEHLDYHKTFANYLNTKLKLISKVKFAIVNYNLKTNTLRSSNKCLDRKLVTFGLNQGDYNQKNCQLKLQIPGDYNIENALAALAVASVLGIDRQVAQKTLEDFQGLAGRMEEIKNNLGIKIIVDFAHTPNALEEALKTLRKLTKKRLVAVFGAAGARDISKRPLMGQAGGKLADIVIITDEDPRFEDSFSIINQIATGATEEGLMEGKNLFKEPDRQKAINLAVKMAQPGDVIGIFGKGHEKSMNYQGVERPWSDQAAVSKALGYG